MPVGVYEKSPEHKAKLAAALKGRPHPAERRENIRAAMERPEVRARLAEASYRGREVGYKAAHWRADRALPREVCVQADATCKGRLEFALRDDAPLELMRRDATGRTFYVGDDPVEAYMVLCSSHHKRHDLRRGWEGVILMAR